MQSYHCGWRANLYIRGMPPGAVACHSTSHFFVCLSLPGISLLILLFILQDFLLIYFRSTLTPVSLIEGWLLKPLGRQSILPVLLQLEVQHVQEAWKANHILDCSKRRLTSKSRGGVHPTLGSSVQK